jgi:hypothetical protein
MRRIERTAVLGCLLLSILIALPAFSSTLTVTNTNDSGFGSLREAILLALPGDTIDFSVTGTITLDSTLTIDKSVTISGPGASNLSISGNDAVVVLATNTSTNVTISGLTITRGFNAAPGGWGGGIVNKGTLTLSNCVIAANNAAAGAGPGGGIFNYSSLRLINSIVSGNSAAYGGGGVWNNGNATLEIADSTISANSAVGDGGGVSNVNGTMTITRTLISGNSSQSSGGGLSNYGTLTLVDSTVSGNSNNGIFNWGGSTLNITGSTISGNTSVGWGGGINSWGTVTIANSTFASNTAAAGGGIFNYAGTMAVSHSTFSGHSANIASGGAIWNQSQLTLKNTILANSPSGGNCGGDAGTSGGHNLSDDHSCSSFFVLAGDLNSIAAGLDPNGLQDNGGPAKTIALLPASPALNAIPVSACTDVDGNAILTDQRGVARPQGAACDFGAFELEPSTVSTPTPTGSPVALSPTVMLPDGGTADVALTFENITASGDTSITTTAAGPPPPSGFKLGQPPVYYDVSTTASFSGTVTLCFSWQEGQFHNEQAIRLFHRETSVWVDVTVSLDTGANNVCGQVSSLSPFVLFETSYIFSGFFQPIDNPPVRNTVKAGSAVPVRFSLNGDAGTLIFDDGYPASQPRQCDTAAPLDSVEETVTAGGSSLSYSSTTGLYTYVWKTDKSWANSCRRLLLQFNDGSLKYVDFTFSK